MRKRVLPVLLAAAIVFASTALCAAEPAPRPNILFILVDDLRWDALGCTGHPFAVTPHIDRLAKEGANFRRAYATTPVCSPSRASFLTGLYSRAHTAVDNADHEALSHRLITFPRLLQAAGYETAFIGKLHMGDTDDSPRPGYDHWAGFKGQGTQFDPILNVNGTRSKFSGHTTDVLSSHAEKFIRQKRTKPFALCLFHKSVHTPLTPDARHQKLFADQAIAYPPSAHVGAREIAPGRYEVEGKPALAHPDARLFGARPGAALEEIVRNQLRLLAAIDESVGRILNALAETGQLDRALIVFTSDNGFFWGEHGLRDKHPAYEEAVRIPLLVRYPPLARAGVKPKGFVLNVDLAPTLLELAGVTIPAGLHGRSFVPLLRGQENGRPAILTEYLAAPQRARIPQWEAVRNERWKLISYLADNSLNELYDLESDPHEMKNLVREPSARGALRQLQTERERLRAELDAAGAPAR